MKHILPKILKSYRQIWRSGQSSAGMTLTELLLAALFGSLVVGAAGISLMKAMAEKQNTTVGVEARQEADRSLNFIKMETEKAKSLPDAATALADWNTEYNGGSSTFLNGKQAVLALAVPGMPHPIIYYVRNFDSTQKWQGPRVVYRLGPAFNNQGEYTNANNPNAWTSEPVVDLVDNSTNKPTCATGETLTPNADNVGFWACVDGSKRMANLIIVRRLNQAYAQTGTYQSQTKVLAKGDPANLGGSVSGNFSLGPSVSLLTSSTPNNPPDPPGDCDEPPVTLGAAGDVTAFALTTSFEVSSPGGNIDGQVALGSDAEPNVSQVSPGWLRDKVFFVDANATATINTLTMLGAKPNGFPADQAVKDVQKAVAKSKSMAPTQTFGSITSSLTISATTTVNVIYLDEIILDGNSQILTISGDADKWFIINVAKDVKLSHGARIEEAGGLSEANVLFNVGGKLIMSDGSYAIGSFLVPNAKAELADSDLNGSLIAAQINLEGTSGNNMSGFQFGNAVPVPLPCP